MQSGQYLYSNETLLKSQLYLAKLQSSPDSAGSLLSKQLDQKDIHSITAEDLILCLMNTRQPQIFAESQPGLDRSDWNADESSILGDISFSTIDTHAYNNGCHDIHNNAHRYHASPLKTNFLFIPSALLRNDRGNITSDMKEVINDDDSLNEDALYKLYERRLLPGLLQQNAQAIHDDIHLVINIPGLGCGQFAGKYEDQVRVTLPRVLRKIFETYADSLSNVHTVNYDPYKVIQTDEFTSSGNRIQLMNRPFLGVLSGEPASQLEFPKDGTDYQGFRLLKIVAWDHFSFPGNDIWQNTIRFGEGRQTDDGVSFASSDVILAMMNMGQFEEDSLPLVTTGSYKPEQAIFYASDPTIPGELLGYKQLSETYTYNVINSMVTCVDISKNEIRNYHGDVINNEEKGSIDFLEPHALQKMNNQFMHELNNKKEIFSKICLSNSDTLYEMFQGNQEKIFNDIKTLYDNIPPEYIDSQRKRPTGLGSSTLDQNIAEILAFKQAVAVAKLELLRSCIEDNIKASQYLCAHSLSYRIAEVLIKAILFSFAVIGMVIASFFAQGFANKAHRQKFADVFFKFHQTAETKALEEFKLCVLGDDNRGGILSYS